MLARSLFAHARYSPSMHSTLALCLLRIPSPHLITLPQRGTAVIPKTSSVGRLGENIDLYDFELSEEDMGKIYELNKDMRYNDPGVFCVGMGGDYPIWD